MSWGWWEELDRIEAEAERAEEAVERRVKRSLPALRRELERLEEEIRRLRERPPLLVRVFKGRQGDLIGVVADEAADRGEGSIRGCVVLFADKVKHRVEEIYERRARCTTDCFMIVTDYEIRKSRRGKKYVKAFAVADPVEFADGEAFGTAYWRRLQQLEQRAGEIREILRRYETVEEVRRRLGVDLERVARRIAEVFRYDPRTRAPRSPPAALYDDEQFVRLLRFIAADLRGAEDDEKRESWRIAGVLDDLYRELADGYLCFTPLHWGVILLDTPFSVTHIVVPVYTDQDECRKLTGDDKDEPENIKRCLSMILGVPAERIEDYTGYATSLGFWMIFFAILTPPPGFDERRIIEVNKRLLSEAMVVSNWEYGWRFSATGERRDRIVKLLNSLAPLRQT